MGEGIHNRGALDVGSDYDSVLALGMPQFGSEPKFEPELFRTGPRFSPRFSESTEPDHKSGSTFRQGRYFENNC